MEEKEVKDRKKLKIVNIIVSIIFSILIIFEVFIFISYFTKKDNTIHIFGKMPYIALYSDETYGFNYGDLVITQDENLFNNIVLKYEKDGNVVIIKGEENKKSEKSTLDIFKIKLEKLGIIILFMREQYVILSLEIILTLICLIIYVIRSQSKNEYTKDYRMIRRIKDIVILVFFIMTYVNIFMIGKVNYKSGDSNNDKFAMNTVPEQNIVKNNVDNNVNNNSQNGINNNVNNNVNNNSRNNSNSNSNNNSNSGSNEIIDSDINFVVTEDSKSWNQIGNLGIFKNAYSNSNKIYPGISGKYEFKVENKSDFYINYKINMEVLSNYNVNLKYKIIKNGEYLNTEYKYINEINIPNYDLANGSKDTYIIEWKWIDDDQSDTLAGQNADLVKYSLKISISGSQK